MKKLKVLTATVLAAFVLSSCIGSFKTTRSLLEWNQSIGSKFANEVVFFAFHIIPVYPVSYLADILVVNSIEFWNDGDAFAMKSGETKEIYHNGIAYKITKKKTKCRIEQVGNEDVYAELSYDRVRKSWRVKNDNYDSEILRFLDDNKVEIYLPNNNKKVIDMTEEGIAELRDMASNDIPVN